MTLLLILCHGAYSGWAGAGAALGAADNGRFGIRLLDSPANRRNDPRALYRIVDHLAPGTTIHRRILVTNQFAKALHIDMGSSAASVDNGKFVVAAMRTSELTNWISFGRSSLDLRAQRVSGADHNQGSRVCIRKGAL